VSDGFEEILGHEAPIQTLRGLLLAGRVPQAMLFHGPEGIGKSMVARAFAAALLCGECQDGSCGDCHSCSLLTHGNHPDLWVVGREAKGATRSRKVDAAGELSRWIRVDQVRKLAELAPQAPRQGRRRVFLIDPADAMNSEAQNALLKTLEEPASRSVLILLAPRPHLLLPTVRSRCLSLPLAPMKVARLVEALRARGFGPDEAAARAALAGGRQCRALSLDVETLADRRETVLQAIERLADGRNSAEQLPRLAADLAGRDEGTLLEGLELLESLLRDIARASLEGAPDSLVHGDLSERLDRIGAIIGPPRAALLVESVERLRGQLRFNLNRTLIAESLLAAVAGAPPP
jgi:DNA polymerase-3 subunit delta'